MRIYVRCIIVELPSWAKRSSFLSTGKKVPGGVPSPLSAARLDALRHLVITPARELEDNKGFGLRRVHDRPCKVGVESGRE